MHPIYTPSQSTHQHPITPTDDHTPSQHTISTYPITPSDHHLLSLLIPSFPFPLMQSSQFLSILLSTPHLTSSHPITPSLPSSLSCNHRSSCLSINWSMWLLWNQPNRYIPPSPTPPTPTNLTNQPPLLPPPLGFHRDDVGQARVLERQAPLLSHSPRLR